VVWFKALHALHVAQVDNYIVHTFYIGARILHVLWGLRSERREPRISHIIQVDSSVNVVELTLFHLVISKYAHECVLHRTTLSFHNVLFPLQDLACTH
jgi:hypothetical protein